MALIEKISSSDLYHMACRMDRGDNFGYKGWNAIGDYLENLSDDLGKDVEVDIVAICCDYNHVESVEDFINGYSNFDVPEDFKNYEVDEQLEVIREYLEENTSVVCCEEDCIIFQTF